MGFTTTSQPNTTISFERRMSMPPIKPRGKYKYVRHGLPKEMPEHRYIMMQIDPRPNASELVVHHIDGDKSNNAPSNLIWMTPSEHSRLHHLGENHFRCDGQNNANYRHGMCVGGQSKEYKHIQNKKSYQSHRKERLAKQNAYGALHREQKRLYDKRRYWSAELSNATTIDRIEFCLKKLNSLMEVSV